MKVYADYAATTHVSPTVAQVIYDGITQQFGNASSIHTVGREARKLLDDARRNIAREFNVDAKEIIFTSGATESNNTAIKGAAYRHQHKGKHVITSQVEHHAVLHVFNKLEQEGFEVTYLPVDRHGVINIEDLKHALRSDTILVSIMTGNNEVGAIQPIDEIGELLYGHQALFHTDGVQAVGHMPLDFRALNIDLFTLTAHKLYGPKGVGLLYVKQGVDLEYQQLGGSQETKRRAGTENIPYILGMTQAIKEAHENMTERNVKLVNLKMHFINALTERDIPFEVNGDLNNQLPHILNLYFPFSDVEIMLTRLDMAGVYVSSGSACTAGSIEPSHVLTAMYGEDKRTKQSVRFSFSYTMTEEEIEFIAQSIQEIYNN
ncbi:MULTISPECIES: cysteine desulfurase family protein [Staphylococcaceae]|uniref:cysteine desulfurase n=1 Tax=Macrococcus psychrotolerans TaxID=3039389 RepID=A0AAU6RKF1_9STAP|nr:MULTISPECIES: cysteine desulfurase family protein [Macrococcus]MDJ1111363.1 cysteine desulfurase family protein [Macrococcus sp. S115]PKE13376.1 cysteine desulfurase NifS [Macrococcus caseolyticus]PKE47839.1 cysteine desulfurase NifS [Macrococcus caseolyticus]PKF14786.1 cysteine desulfurase NifS [Macrococcus caseolyticus]PNZ73957.1 cysteine desulfurase [Macrococcus caseolyticus]